MDHGIISEEGKDGERKDKEVVKPSGSSETRASRRAKMMGQAAISSRLIDNGISRGDSREKIMRSIEDSEKVEDSKNTEKSLKDIREAEMGETSTNVLRQAGRVFLRKGRLPRSVRIERVAQDVQRSARQFTEEDLQDPVMRSYLHSVRERAEEQKQQASKKIDGETSEVRNERLRAFKGTANELKLAVRYLNGEIQDAPTIPYSFEISRLKDVAAETQELVIDRKRKIKGIIEEPATGNEIRARNVFEGIVDFGDLKTGPYNSVTDVGVLVGHGTVGDTGLTVLTLKDIIGNPCPAAVYSPNANGMFTGTEFIRQYGLTGPFATTGTGDVGSVYSGMMRWYEAKKRDANIAAGIYPYGFVAETHNGRAHDIYSMPIRKDFVASVIDAARDGHVKEGNIGGGVGMHAYDYAAGFGTSSRIPEVDGSPLMIGDQPCIVGVTVQCNQGYYDQFILGGDKRIGEKLRQRGVEMSQIPSKMGEGELAAMKARARDASIIGTVWVKGVSNPTDLYHLAQQMNNDDTGSVNNNGSGDFFMAVGLERPQENADGLVYNRTLPKHMLDPMSKAVREATTEAILNSMVAAKQRDATNGYRSVPLSHGVAREILERKGTETT